jgi:hypothetical protein
VEQGTYNHNDILRFFTIKNRLLLFYSTEKQFIHNYDCLGGQHTIILKLDAGNDWIEADLKSKFEVNTIRNPSMILGIKLIQKKNQISLSQTHFIDSLLNKFGLT